MHCLYKIGLLICTAATQIGIFMQHGMGWAFMVHACEKCGTYVHIHVHNVVRMKEKTFLVK